MLTCCVLTGKMKTMFCSGNTVESLGIAPLAISWLFQFIEKEQNGSQSRVSVTMTSFELSGMQELHTDLLSSDGKMSCYKDFHLFCSQISDGCLKDQKAKNRITLAKP